MRRAHRSLIAGLATLSMLAGGLMLTAAPALAAEEWSVIGTFGGSTSTPADPQPLSAATGVAINQSTNNVYVTDTNNNRIEYFNSTGTYIGQFNASTAPTGTLSSPAAIAVDNSSSASDPSKEDVYVIDKGHNIVDKFTANGTYLGQEFAPEPGEELRDVAVGPLGEVWVVTDYGIYYSTLREFSNAVENKFLLSPRFKNTWEEEAYANGVKEIAVDAERDLYILNNNGFRKINPRWEVISDVAADWKNSTGLSLDLSSKDLYVDAAGTSVEQASQETGAVTESFGSGPLNDGQGVAVDSASGDVYVAEPASSRVLFFAHSASPQAPPSAPSTDPATQVASTSATLNGELNPEGAPGGVGYYFSYNAGAGSSCTGPGSVRSTFDSGTANATGEVEVPVSATVKVRAREEYVFCLVADKYGATPGPQKTFTASPAAPEIVAGSESVVGVEHKEGAFTATINPSNSETTYSLEYSTAGSVAANTLEDNTREGEEIETFPGAEPLSAAGGEQSVTINAKTYPSSSYYYRFVATNETGTTYGKVQVYTKLPKVVGESASGADLTHETLDATINPEWLATNYQFEYAKATEAGKALLEKGEGTQVAGGQTGEEFNPEPMSAIASGLQPYTKYYYRVVLINEATTASGDADAGQPVRGEIKEFTTESLPFVSAGGASSITSTSTTLSGTVLAPVRPATYYFQYISDAAYQAALAKGLTDPYEDSETTTPLPIAANTIGHPVGPVAVTGLLPGETYRYRLLAKNQFGVRYGEEGEAEHTFTTAGKTAPIVSTGGASGVSQNAATLSGTVSTNGLQTNYVFEIGTEPGNYGPATGLGAIGGAATEEVKVTLGELQPGTTYYYRVEATNADGTVRGQPGVFTTPGFPTLLTPQTSPPLIAVPRIAFPEEEKMTTGGSSTKTLTNKQKLSKALKQCKGDKSRGKEAKCEKAARKKYPVAKGKKEGKPKNERT